MANTFNQFFADYVLQSMTPDNSFLSKFEDVSSQVIGGRVLNIPYADHSTTITKNGYGTAEAYNSEQFSDENLTLTLNCYRTKALKVQNVIEDWTAYGVLNSAIETTLKNLGTYVANDALNDIYALVDGTRHIETTGEVGVGNGPAGVNAKKLVYQDIVKIAQKFAEDDVVGEKYLLLNPQMYYELLEDEAVVSANRFGQATLATGVIDKIANVNIMMRSNTGIIDDSDDVWDLNETFEGTNGGSFLSLAFTDAPGFCYVAKGDVNVMIQDDARSYGQIMTSETYMGATIPRPATKRVGVYILKQG